jgi:hypothetical protein
MSSILRGDIEADSSAVRARLEDGPCVSVGKMTSWDWMRASSSNAEPINWQTIFWLYG